MTSYIANFRGPQVELQISIKAPTKALATEAGLLFAAHEHGGLEVTSVYERPHVLRVYETGEIYIARFGDYSWEPYPDDRAALQQELNDRGETNG